MVTVRFDPSAIMASGCVDVPLRDGSGHVSLPTGAGLPTDVSQVRSLLSQERASLSMWVSVGAEYYLAGKAAEQEPAPTTADGSGCAAGRGAGLSVAVQSGPRFSGSCQCGEVRQ